MSNNSETILSANTHPGDSTSVAVVGSNFKGDGYYGRSDGLHTAQYDYVGFTGTMKIEATLANTPTNDDWFAVDTLVLSNQTGTTIANFTGNYIWLKASVVYTDGTVNSIVMNH
jgi:hypothetical protein|tara:strand:+ start:384 stop:725 length:342 start_codon:yes stop_codon:yes gene_type:complete